MPGIDMCYVILLYITPIVCRLEEGLIKSSSPCLLNGICVKPRSS